MRDILNGVETFTALAEGAPGLSRALLSSRLHQLEVSGVIEVNSNPARRGKVYRPTAAGRDLGQVMLALGTWGERWIELAPEHLDPGVVLESWCRQYLNHDTLPDNRIVVRFDFPDLPKKGNQLWMIFNRVDSEVCRTDPGFPEDLVVTAQSRAIAEWHLGHIRWSDALKQESIRVDGSPRLAKALPTWNKQSGWAHLNTRLDPGRPRTRP